MADPLPFRIGPIWDSPGTPEWLQDVLSAQLRKVGIEKRGDLLAGNRLRAWLDLLGITNKRLAKFKYIQLLSRDAPRKVEIDITIETSLHSSYLKKEVVKSYGALCDAEDQRPSPPFTDQGKMLAGGTDGRFMISIFLQAIQAS
ncbi:hypothetical protein NDU88_002334 [Pleurodeles waltl]|uniref:Uncharacterized protein n=1 Tax=Pleurodeles waltl TaxID=8319 RepID=A0AAV7W2Q4_PLEWA|nr:hypothetical protein NDU88_002334 [Pleurodeles waltl]